VSSVRDDKWSIIERTPYYDLRPRALGPISGALAQGDDFRPTGYLLVWGYVMNALAQLGMVSELPSENQTTIATLPTVAGEDRKDYFVEKDGVRFAGTHLLADLWDAENLSDPVHIDTALRAAAERAGATILHSHFHHFTPNGGVSGVVVLAESHISIHTWPERHFAAIDIFMCGCCNPHDAIPVLQEAFSPGRVDLDEQRRGQF
jgi:S-adenosylmethionine decarboxylase